MHVVKTCDCEVCANLHVDGWEIKKVTECSELHELKKCIFLKTYGDILSSDCKNVKICLRSTEIYTVAANWREF